MWRELRNTPFRQVIYTRILKTIQPVYSILSTSKFDQEYDTRLHDRSLCRVKNVFKVLVTHLCSLYIETSQQFRRHSFGWKSTCQKNDQALSEDASGFSPRDLQTASNEGWVSERQQLKLPSLARTSLQTTGRFQLQHWYLRVFFISNRSWVKFESVNIIEEEWTSWSRN